MSEPAARTGLPLAGVRVLEYAQYVAGPFAAMLLADLGADVVKVEPPAGDAWRHYEPVAPGESRAFHALNRNKRSVVVDLKSASGRQASQALIRGSDVVLHNFPARRAELFGLDRVSVRDVNPRAVWCCVSALGSDGPQASTTAFDLIAQALSGLLVAGAHGETAVPQRAGGIAMADFTAGLLAAVSVLAGLLGRDQEAPGIEVSLLGAALAVQAQQFVSIEDTDRAGRAGDGSAGTAITPDELEHEIRARRRHDELEPYYRAYAAADGYVALACLHERQRVAAAALLGLDDPFVANPQAPPASDDEHGRRRALVCAFERRISAEPVAAWVRRFREAGVPAAEVRRLAQLFEDEQVCANGLVQTLHDDRLGAVKLLGSPFKIDGVAAPSRRPSPGLGEHTEEVLGACVRP